MEGEAYGAEEDDEIALVQASAAMETEKIHAENSGSNAKPQEPADLSAHAKPHERYNKYIECGDESRLADACPFNANLLQQTGDRQNHTAADSPLEKRAARIRAGAEKGRPTPLQLVDEQDAGEQRHAAYQIPDAIERTRPQMVKPALLGDECRSPNQRRQAEKSGADDAFPIHR